MIYDATKILWKFSWPILSTAMIVNEDWLQLDSFIWDL